jgi:endonuclease/exonuclease/phosphatase (EEP) superfamily protein YafD
MGPELLRAATPVAAERSNSRALKVLTFNSWSNNIDPRGSVDGVLRANADVVALQETEGLSASAWRRLLAVYPFYASCKSECDLFLLSKTPWSAEGSEQHPVRGGYFTLVWASTAAPDGRPLTLATTHYAWPLPPTQQASQRAALAQAVRGLDASDLILAGDFNLTPWSAAMRGQDAALAPLQRRTLAMFTWPANIAIVKWPAPFPLLPIDHVYAGPAWRTVAVQRLPRLGSDHYPVLVTLSRR